MVDKPGVLDIIAKELNMSYEFLGMLAMAGMEMLLTSLPIKSKREVHRGGTEVSFTPGTKKLNGRIAQAGETHRISRGLLIVDMANGEELRCGVTHLDHISMEERKWNTLLRS